MHFTAMFLLIVVCTCSALPMSRDQEEDQKRGGVSSHLHGNFHNSLHPMMTERRSASLRKRFDLPSEKNKAVKLDRWDRDYLSTILGQNQGASGYNNNWQHHFDPAHDESSESSEEDDYDYFDGYPDDCFYFENGYWYIYTDCKEDSQKRLFIDKSSQLDVMANKQKQKETRGFDPWGNPLPESLEGAQPSKKRGIVKSKKVNDVNVKEQPTLSHKLASRDYGFLAMGNKFGGGMNGQNHLNQHSQNQLNSYFNGKDDDAYYYGYYYDGYYGYYDEDDDYYDEYHRAKRNKESRQITNKKIREDKKTDSVLLEAVKRYLGEMRDYRIE